MGEPYILNVIGDFYVEANCCTLCGVPEAIAPDLFATSDRGHCYVKKQPETADEFDRMTKVFATQDLGCIRYRGTDIDAGFEEWSIHSDGKTFQTERHA